ncbi:hypothetical protein FTUN_5269 [Frigoriglobus tundricola]|uniref:Uncharacterized protein n=1 Tax=Frigoriglobus tundricola TaxID=2774151 RepID=A0A6M5YXL3_9BACT|nr:hypothetical protein FTUN_5269 [Frigoriglobus tundricola]
MKQAIEPGEKCGVWFEVLIKASRSFKCEMARLSKCAERRCLFHTDAAILRKTNCA